MKNHGNIRVLYYTRNDIGGHFVKAFEKFINVCVGLTELNLNGCRTSEGFLSPILLLLKKCEYLRRLYLSELSITD